MMNHKNVYFYYVLFMSSSSKSKTLTKKDCFDNVLLIN